jgi:hypothetical protein
MEVSRIEICPEDHLTGERWDPLGAPNDQEEEKSVDRPEFEYCDNQLTYEKLRNLEEEQELLNSSLFALTTHFAQV